MTLREEAAYTAGIEAMRQAALTAAVTIEIRDDARDVRQQAAIAALRGLADGARALVATSRTAAEPTTEAEIPAGASTPTQREIATARGFTGDTCATCGSLAMKRAGTCLTCQACGSTTGCA